MNLVPEEKVSWLALFIDYLPMLPIQLLLLNLISDFPMIAISTEHARAVSLCVPFWASLRAHFCNCERLFLHNRIC